ncbi:HPr family phosphocarrier protein [Shewanella surugensis]|uniref:Phosphocarrier protein HPr n=1 Tax=Shewanella surugensis TaxID=212020 RepID=A0ABT0LCQ2_9GAMM|nr:HPr family phosphocarrier protein [Shewanella surugensis]MCL1125476.1 HPr family phosphocarrier protein [Shewanella surugensis]
MKYEKSVIITAQHGLHTRPAALLVKQAKSYSCDIFILCQGKQASAKSLFKLQTLGLYHGIQVTVMAEGENAQTAVEDVSNLLLKLS